MLFDIINNVSGIIRGLKLTPTTHYKVFWGSRLYREIQPSNLPSPQIQPWR